MKKMNHSILFLLLFSIQAGDIALAQTVVLQDNLQGSTVGTQVGGGFTGEGYKPGTGENHILYDVPAQIQNGYVEFQAKGFNFNDFPPVNATNQSYETSFLIMYDGRGIPEPIVYFFDYRNNYFRWDVTYRSDKYDSPGVGNRWKCKIHIAEDSPERLNSTYAVYPVVPENTADWGAEPNGIYSYWDPNQWYTIRVEWDNNGKNFRFYRDGELVWDSKLDSGDPLTDNGVYTITSPYPWLPVDFKIHLGSGPDRYSSKMPNMVFRNFKVVSTGAIQNTAPVITSTAVTSGSVGQLYSYDVNASGNPAPTYSLTTLPSGMTINPTSGVIQWTPSSTGNFNVTVVASNGISPDASQSFTINVQSSTTFAPIITSTAVTSGTVGQLYTYDVETDANPNPTYSLTTFPSGMTINSTTGLIQWTPLSAGNFDVTVVASNGINPDATQSFSVTVQESQSGSCPPSLVSYWKLDEISGNAYADFIGTNNATSTSVPTPLAGRVNGAQQFNGTSNGITAPGIAAYDFSTNTSFTFEAWIKHVTGSYTGEEMIVERKTSSGALAINLKFNSTSVSFSVRNTASEIYDVTGTTNLYDNNWHHVVGVRDANTNQLKIYVDGVLENTVSATYTAGFASPTTEINIGWRSSTSAGFFDGIIDEVAIYDAALDAVSISQHYSNGLQNQGYCNEIQPINVPTNLSAVLNPSDTTNVILSWLNNSDNELGFVIERKTGDSLSIELFAVVDTVGADVTGYEDTSVDDTTTYTYRVYAFNADIVSDYSNMAQVVTPVPVELTSFFATLLNQGVLLEWETASELNNAGFNVQRSKDNSKFFDIAYIKGQGTTTNKSFYSYNDQSVSTGKYSYRLKQIDLDGSVTYSQVVSVDLGMVNSFVLEQNYPNPFNPSTQIRFSIPEVTNVKLIVSDALGREIALLVDGKLNAGDYKIDFDADGISSGIYICILITDTFKQSRKMILMK